MLKKNRPLIGGHVSGAGGVSKSIANAKTIGAEVIQIFGASPRSFQANLTSDEEALKFKNAMKESAVKKVYLHGAYLVNLATDKDELFNLSVKNLARHLEIAEKIGAEGLIFHVGSGKEAPREEAIKKAVKGIRQVLSLVKGKSFLIIENAAGGGEKLGATPEDMEKLQTEVNSDRLKFCIDTAHAFEAGQIESYTTNNIKKFLDLWDEAIGLKNVVALHINDSKTEFNSKHDRHENIGEGYIGLEGFKNLAKEIRIWHADWILEVPGFLNEGPDKKNIDILRNCFN